MVAFFPQALSMPPLCQERITLALTLTLTLTLGQAVALPLPFNNLTSSLYNSGCYFRLNAQHATSLLGAYDPNPNPNHNPRTSRGSTIAIVS